MDDGDEPASLAELLQATSSNSPFPDLTTPLVSRYLDRLVSLPLDDVILEPELVTKETVDIEHDITNLCYREYPTLIAVHQCSEAVHNAFEDFDSSLTRLINSVPELEDESRTFAQRTQKIQAKRRRAAVLQENQEKVAELLDMPRLMETCVRNGYYQEAIDLSAHAKSLRAAGTHQVLLQDVLQEMEAVTQMMLVQLVSLLRESVKLPTMLKAISYLRQLSHTDDTDLATIFLLSRLHHYRNRLLIAEREKADSIRYLRKYIDISREHLYDIITQFLTVFEVTPMVLTPVIHSIDTMCQTVADLVPQISGDSASLSSLLVQLGYCAQSFARLGLDFSVLLDPPFSRTILGVFDSAVKEASAELINNLESASKVATPPSHVLIYRDNLASLLSSQTNDSNAESTSLSPDTTLMPPLVKYVNAHLTALNSLRLLAPTHLSVHLTTSQASALASATVAVAEFLEQGSPRKQNGEIRPPHKHRRSISSPRAHLLRRSTETQLTPEILAARRQEEQEVSLKFAQAWIQAVKHLQRNLSVGVLRQESSESEIFGARVLQEAMTGLESWMNSVRQPSPPGAEPKTPVISDISSPVAFETNVFSSAPLASDGAISAEPDSIMETPAIQSELSEDPIQEPEERKTVVSAVEQQPEASTSQSHEPRSPSPMTAVEAPPEETNENVQPEVADESDAKVGDELAQEKAVSPNDDEDETPRPPASPAPPSPIDRTENNELAEQPVDADPPQLSEDSPGLSAPPDPQTKPIDDNDKQPDGSDNENNEEESPKKDVPAVTTDPKPNASKKKKRKKKQKG